MDQETAQRIEHLEYQVALLYRHLGLDPGESLLAPAPGLQPPAPQDAVPGGADPRLPREFYDLLARDKKIQAIKVYRDVTGVGLKQAKDYVEALERNNRRR
ncbi:MAG TPA: ribosomal protein L7/L12 [Actinospica sp.]|nr:ribosomal protein L7/L12 [Actinospica sp.]